MNSVAGTVAVVYGTQAGVGGLGIQSANAVDDLTHVFGKVVALGPGQISPLGCKGKELEHLAMPALRPAPGRLNPLRWLTGRLQFLNDTRIGQWAVREIARIRPDCCYCLSQVALETLKWANSKGVFSILESPNGHIMNFRNVYLKESKRWGHGIYLGHPNRSMIQRVCEEYAQADIIRVSSQWAKRSFADFGVPNNKVVVIPQRPTAHAIRPAKSRLPPTGPIRVCFVGTLDLRKGFVYLLRAARKFGPDRISLRLVGGTVDRLTRRLLDRERRGISVEVLPGDPTESLQWAELFVLPTLEDGSPFAVVEAMAAGIPLIVTDQCGNAPFIRHGDIGWIVPAADEDALFEAIQLAYARREYLPRMGDAARADWERMASAAHDARRTELLLESVLRGMPTLKHTTTGMV